MDISMNLKEEVRKIKREELINLIIRQTDYTEEKILERLKYWNYNSLYVIKEYLNPNFFEKKEKNEKTLDQRMRGEMRKFCDKGQRIYDIKKKLSKGFHEK